MIYDNTNIGKNVRFFRKRMGLRQDDLCRKLSVGRNTLSNWENGKISTLSLDQLVELCNVFNCTISDLLVANNASELDHLRDSLYERERYLRYKEQRLKEKVAELKEVLDDFWN